MENENIGFVEEHSKKARRSDDHCVSFIHWDKSVIQGKDILWFVYCEVIGKRAKEHGQLQIIYLFQ